MARLEPRVAATIQIDEAASECWDVVIIGAGPAGAMAAREAALGGARVLLADRASFPRPKVCGCCVNGAAVGTLTQAGLGDLLPRCHAEPLHTVQLANAGRSARIRLGGSVALSRERLDTELIRAAIDASAEFLDQTQVLIGETTSDARNIILKKDATEETTTARAIVVAGGLGCRVFAEPDGDERRVSQSSRVGAGVVLDDAPAEYAGGTIYMACHRHGYVGLVRLEDDRLDIAAALDAKAIKELGSLNRLAEHILMAANLPVTEALIDADWHGTGRLTQFPKQVAAERCFFIGDAAGYDEPFTGEGIAYAFASARAVAPIVLDCLKNGRESDAMQAWTETHQGIIMKRSRLCRRISRLVRYPTFVGVAVRLLALAPSLANPVVRSLNASFETKLSTSATAERQR